MEGKKILILILAYNAERHIAKVLDRIPKQIWESESCEIIIIDDSSTDETVRLSIETNKPIRVLKNPSNQGYGGNQKLGYLYAIKNNFDVVALLHGDGQYAPEVLLELIKPVADGEVEAVFGSRMMNKNDALKGGMPFYKFAGNIILTKLQNTMLRTKLSEFHTGYRIYSVAALKRIPFEYNSDWFDFDTDIIIQFADNNFRIKEMPIPTHYGDEVCHVDGIRYAYKITRSTISSRLQKFGVLYNARFDYQREIKYQDKTNFDSSHKFAVDRVIEGKRVLDIGCGDGYVGRKLRDKGCYVLGMDEAISNVTIENLQETRIVDLNDINFGGDYNFDCILFLDVIEHLKSPEDFMRRLRAAFAKNAPKIILTTPNIAFIVMRLMLLIGQFNYGKRGILDMTHTRLFTFRTLEKLVEASGFKIIEERGIPAPIPLAVGDNAVGRFLLSINSLLINLSRTLFSYQIGMVIKPRADLDTILSESIYLGAESAKNYSPSLEQ